MLPAAPLPIHSPLVDWLPSGKSGAVCFSIDDVHPGRSTDAYEAGGDLDQGQLRHVRWLLDRHQQLRVTLFLCADWREISPVPTRKTLARIPYLRDRVLLAKTLPAATMRLSRHPEFVRYLKAFDRAEIALHGLHHINFGVDLPVEFKNKTLSECEQVLREIREIFEEAALPFVPGMNPPGWDLSPELAQAMTNARLRFVVSARDIVTPVARSAKTNMSGLKGASMIYPTPILDGRLLHFTSNFQATSEIDRAREIIDHNGLLAVKAHIVKNAAGHVALDGLDLLYRNYLDALFTFLEDRYGESLWWTSFDEITQRYINASSGSCRDQFAYQPAGH
jgi:hypothetical protein